MTDAEIEGDLAVNIAGGLHTIRAAVGLFEGCGGTILVTGGLLAVMPHPDYASLGLGKAALRNLVEGLAPSLGARASTFGWRQSPPSSALAPPRPPASRTCCGPSPVTRRLAGSGSIQPPRCPSLPRNARVPPRRHLRRQPMITSQIAQTAIAAGLAKAAELGVRATIAVLDAGAHLKAFMRMDGAVLGSIDIASARHGPLPCSASPAKPSGTTANREHRHPASNAQRWSHDLSRRCSPHGPPTAR